MAQIGHHPHKGYAIITSKVTRGGAVKQVKEKSHTLLSGVRREFRYKRRTFGSFSTPEQIGAMVKFLCSQAASNITGSSITMDSGWTAQ
jgi:NAD(P)-dependent dehydrogenase (short-subunit alcohol dehydrogenase family)